MDQISLSNFTPAAKALVQSAQSLADDSKHKQVLTAHFLLVALDRSDVEKVLELAGCTISDLKSALIVSLSKLDKSTKESTLSGAMIDLLKLSEKEAEESGSNVGVESLLDSLSYDERGGTVELLRKFNLQPGELKQYFFSSREAAEKAAKDRFTTDLTKLAKEGHLDPVIGRHIEVRRLINILGRRHKNHPILIGEVGVGKKSIVKALASNIASGNVSKKFHGLRVITLEAGKIASGIKQRGEIEERMKSALREIIPEETILFIDGVESLFAQGSSMSGAGDVLSSLLSKDNLRIITSTTPEAFRKLLEKESSIGHQFTPINVEPSTPEETEEILRGIAVRYETFHRVKVGDPAITAAVKLAKRYLKKRALPESAIDLIDEASARKKFEVDGIPAASSNILSRFNSIRAQLVGLVGDEDKASRATKEKLETEINQLSPVIEGIISKLYLRRKENQVQEVILTEEDVAAVLQDWTGIPLSKMLEGESDKLAKMDENISSRVVGQDEAVKAVCKSIRRSRLGLRDLGKPIGSFLFLGGSGSGKTELAKTLAAFLFDDEKSMIRFDMSEFREAHQAMRLTGAPPGYAQADEGGQLTEAVAKNPYSVILFDEVEKAAPEVFNLLLQVLDDGRLTDGRGKTVDFTNTVIIMTSNIGSDKIMEASEEDFATTAGQDSLKAMIKSSLLKTLRPEFLNRIDDQAIFRPLSKPGLRKIVDIQLKILGKLLEPKEIVLELTEEAKNRLVDLGYDPAYGARPLKRAIMSNIQDPIAEKLVAGQCKEGAIIKIDVDSNGFTFKEI